MENEAVGVRVYIGLGSNLGDRKEALVQAVAALPPQVQITKQSPVYETEPWGYEDQPPFLNQVVEGRTELDPRSLLEHLKAIESRLGRQPSFRYGPRRIDLDLLFYSKMVIENGDLRVPHPRIQERAFVLVPLADVAPDLRHPVLNRSVRELLEEVNTDGVQPYEPNG